MTYDILQQMKRNRS